MTTLQGAEGNPNPDAKNVDTYRVELRCIPADVHFRMERKTPRPMIRGTQTAHVVAQPGEAISTDNHGPGEGQVSLGPQQKPRTTSAPAGCVPRRLGAGSNYGAMFVPRSGQEVLVSFMEGNPDRPVIGGTVYNGNNNAHHNPLPHKTRSVIRSATTAGSTDDGGNGNELYFEDSTGSENLYMRAQKDFTVDVQHDQVLTIQNNRTITVKAGSETVTVSAGSSSTTAATTITLTVAGTSITVSAGSVTITAPSITLDSPAVTITGALTASGGIVTSTVTASGTVTAGAVVTGG